MPSKTRESSFSYDPGTRRAARREHWIPFEPGKTDLKPRGYPILHGGSGDEPSRREIEEIATGSRR